MPSDSTVETAKDIRKFSIIQLAITTVFLAAIFWLFDGTSGGYPPLWIPVFLIIAIAVAAFFSERVWLSATPLDPAEDPAKNEAKALDVFTGQTVRKLIISEVPLLIAVLLCFVFTVGGWPVLIAGIPGLAVQAWETFPHLRNTSMAAAMLDSQGATSGLVENFMAR